ncbi:MAG: ribosome silencing factor [Gammaproteobacteria bacterium]|nr:ribosome silencing factor [Gammaproteobacteria bacterium]MAY03923.1 ribosome silencing factor [Gammaproteobacteria bacterium]
MNVEELKELAIQILDDMKGKNITCLDVRGLTSVCDFMLVVTGTSNRHVKAMSDELVKKVKQAEEKVYSVEGQNKAEWILIDLGDVVVHVMLAASRELYDLESLWSMTEERIQE